MANPARQFVIQRHSTPDGVHWDLMLEMDDCLWTWRLHVPPAEIKNKPITVERIHDHPLRFLSYEGPVQNNTANVRIADRGLCRIINPTENSLVFKPQGTILKGTFILTQTANPPCWTLRPTSSGQLR